MPETRETFDDLPILSELRNDLVRACRTQAQPRQAPTPLRRSWSLPARLTAALAVPAAVVLAAVVATVVAPGRHSPVAGRPHTSRAGHLGIGAGVPAVHAHSPLVHLADYITKAATPPGDATLVSRTTALGGGRSVTVYDLYTDSGQYFFSRTRGGLAAQVSAHHNLAGGLFAREIAAAKLAATGNVKKAGERMAAAPLPSKYVPQRTQPIRLSGKDATKPGVHPGEIEPTLYDNYVWENSQDALVAGSGDQQVRAGVLRLLATLPDVTVTPRRTAGQRVLALTAGAAEVGGGSIEQIMINATTGVPVSVASGSSGHALTPVVTYKVARVTTRDIAAGKR